MADFERFQRDMLQLKSPATVTVHTRGTLSLNRSAFELAGMPDSVELLYDRARQIIGLRPTDPREANAYPLRRASSASPSGPWIVSAMAFVRYYDIDLRCTRRWSAFLDGRVLCVDLSAGDGVPAGPARPTT